MALIKKRKASLWDFWNPINTYLSYSIKIHGDLLSLYFIGLQSSAIALLIMPILNLEFDQILFLLLLFITHIFIAN